MAHQEPVGRRLRSVEGLRAIAALSVVLFHVTRASQVNGFHPAGVGGRILLNLGYGVVLFFVLSGFLLFRPWAAALLVGGRRPEWRNFLVNRTLRIVPAYWVVLVVIVLLLGMPAGISARLLPLHFLLLQNYRRTTANTVLGPAWSLTVEAVFYVFLPVYGGLLLSRLGDSLRQRVTWLALSLGALGLASAAWGPLAHMLTGRSQDADPVTHFSFWSNFDLFVPGMILAVLHSWWAGEAPAPWRPRLWFGAGTGALLLVACVRAGDWTGVEWIWIKPLVALACGLLLAPVVLGAARPVARVLSWPALTAIGAISYSIYLWHDPLIQLAYRAHVISFDGAFWPSALELIGLTLLVATASYLAIERPFMALRRSWAGSGRPSEAAP